MFGPMLSISRGVSPALASRSAIRPPPVFARSIAFSSFLKNEDQTPIRPTMPTIPSTPSTSVSKTTLRKMAWRVKIKPDLVLERLQGFRERVIGQAMIVHRQMAAEKRHGTKLDPVEFERELSKAQPDYLVPVGPGPPSPPVPPPSLDTLQPSISWESFPASEPLTSPEPSSTPEPSPTPKPSSTLEASSTPEVSTISEPSPTPKPSAASEDLPVTTIPIRPATKTTPKKTGPWTHIRLPHYSAKSVRQMQFQALRAIRYFKAEGNPEKAKLAQKELAFISTHYQRYFPVSATRSAALDKIFRPRALDSEVDPSKKELREVVAATREMKAADVLPDKLPSRVVRLLEKQKISTGREAAAGVAVEAGETLKDQAEAVAETVVAATEGIQAKASDMVKTVKELGEKVMGGLEQNVVESQQEQVEVVGGETTKVTTKLSQGQKKAARQKRKRAADLAKKQLELEAAAQSGEGV